MVVIDYYLLATIGFIICGSLVAVFTKKLISAIISLGVVGFGISVAFLFLGAPDLAIIQIPVEVLLLILLIRATIGRDVESTGKIINLPAFIIITVVMIGLCVFGYFAFTYLNEFGKPVFDTMADTASKTYLEKGSTETGAMNMVSAVILDYRAYDTLGEATVLFTAIIGALAILRGRARRKEDRKK
jgi:multisubunit Na+/H+ antiporter MnhB subunit